MIRNEWAKRLRHAAQADLVTLVVPEAQVKGTLTGDLGQIEPQDVEFLAKVGLPQIKGDLSPNIEPLSRPHGNERVFMLGTYDPPGHMFVAEPATGVVVKVSRQTEGPYAFRVPVNASIRQFGEMAWRYFHMDKVLREMQDLDGEDIVQGDESKAIRLFVWDTAVGIDPSVGSDGTENFWWGASWQYL